MSENASVSIARLKSLIEINTRINSNYADSNALLVSILESVMSMVECESSSLLLVDKDDDSLHFAVALGPKGPEAKKIKVSKNSIAGWVYTHNQSIIINDVSADPRFNSEVQNKTKYITRNMIAFPMHVSGVCMGVIELINKAGNQDFDQNDLEILELLGDQAGLAYQNAANLQHAQANISYLQYAASHGPEYHAFIAKSPIILDMLQVIGDVAKTNSSVLIIGESGVGKELFAEQIHLKSPRNAKPFIRVSCAALSPSLLESELFGHVKGAYTNAVSDQKGRFEMADGGTLFLDEIGEMPLNLQSKLLRVLQTKKFERVGSSTTISVDVRIVAATNRDLEAMVKAGEFRGDLYYRLNVLPLNVPPLRERKEDIQPLAEYFLTKCNADTKKFFEGFSSAAESALRAYYWPGNIRELENTVERACILGKPPYIEVGDLRLPRVEGTGGSRRDDGGTVSTIVDTLVDGEDRTLHTALTEFKKQYVSRILEECGWNQTAAAKVLDVQRTYVCKLINDLDIRK